MEPECSLPRSQQPATCPYLQLHHFSPRASPPQSYLTRIHFNIILLILIFILFYSKVGNKQNLGWMDAAFSMFKPHWLSSWMKISFFWGGGGGGGLGLFPNYWNFATISKDVFLIFMLWFLSLHFGHETWSYTRLSPHLRQEQSPKD